VNCSLPSPIFADQRSQDGLIRFPGARIVGRSISLFACSRRSLKQGRARRLASTAHSLSLSAAGTKALYYADSACNPQVSSPQKLASRWNRHPSEGGWRAARLKIAMAVYYRTQPAVYGLLGALLATVSSCPAICAR
jgi:hypothetical protein